MNVNEDTILEICQKLIKEQCVSPDDLQKDFDLKSKDFTQILSEIKARFEKVGMGLIIATNPKGEDEVVLFLKNQEPPMDKDNLLLLILIAALFEKYGGQLDYDEFKEIFKNRREGINTLINQNYLEVYKKDSHQFIGLSTRSKVTLLPLIEGEKLSQIWNYIKVPSSFEE